jgi:hypothetical protein
MFRRNALSLVLAVAVCSAAATALAQSYAGPLKVERLRHHENGEVRFGTDIRPADTCSDWGEYFRFDAGTPDGKRWLAILITAKAAGKPIDVWYTPSSNPAADQYTGCYAAISRLQGVALTRSP